MLTYAMLGTNRTNMSLKATLLFLAAITLAFLTVEAAIFLVGVATSLFEAYPDMKQLLRYSGGFIMLPLYLILLWRRRSKKGP